MKDSYPAISRYEKHSYLWAMDQLDAGNEVRRWGWPIEVRKYGRSGGDGGLIKTEIAIWHVYMCNDIVKSKCQGFSMGYTPSPEDLDALDWQTVDEVTSEQIETMDARRFRHWPSGQFDYSSPVEHHGGMRMIGMVVLALFMFTGLMLVFFGRR